MVREVKNNEKTLGVYRMGTFVHKTKAVNLHYLPLVTLMESPQTRYFH